MRWDSGWQAGAATRISYGYVFSASRAELYPGPSVSARIVIPIAVLP